LTSLTSSQSGLALRVYSVGLADAVGLGMYLALSALFLNKAVGLPSEQVGLVLSLAGVASLFGAMPIARAAQRHGLRLGLFTLFIARAAAFMLLASVDSLAGALLASALAGLMSRGTAPLVESALIARDGNALAVKALARLRTVRNAGIAAGGLPAGFAVWVGQEWAYRWVLACSALLFLLAALICWSFPDKEMRSSKPPAPTRDVLSNRPFVALTAMYGALTLSAILLGVGLPLWVINQSHAPHWAVGAIQLINTVLVVALQDWFSRGTDQLKRASSHMQRGSLAAALASGLVVLGATWGMLADVLIILSVVVLFTLAELYIVAGAEGAALLHIPDGQRPTYLAAFNLGFAFATVIGPPLVAFTSTGPAWGWLAWAGFFTLMAIAVPLLPAPKTHAAETSGLAVSPD